ncbi:uncharacterized protein G2W53_015709 [Senna tora]|uniref:DUF2470 domain-containing protein n=1 Tax=Senna tora TaxID=362788 RepID=A0A834WVQ1_9FABA|nr:uncharacterized protein G2W53_015709 [Senna tora]
MSPAEGICCSISNGIANSLIKSPLDSRRVPDLSSMRYKSPFFGPSQFLWLSMGNDQCLSKVCVAADYSDSVPDSSSYVSNQGYHPLEDLKPCHNIRQTELSSAEIARTTVEANRNALLVFPGAVHCEPHEQISWAEYEYLIDDYGDIYFEIFDDANILEDRGTSNPVRALIGMDIPLYDNRRTASEYNIFNSGHNDKFLLDDDYIEVVEPEELNLSVDWGIPDTTVLVHPIFFAKCLTKAVNMECDKRMDHPSNGVSILGYLRPAFADEESYLRTVYRSEDGDGYNSDWKDGENFCSNSMSDHRETGLTLYRLEILKIELFSVYGCQAYFQDAEPDILVHSTRAILEHFNQRFDVALKALCKKKGLDVEGARLIGVDSLGMDVRVFSGAEVKTHRFPFKVPVSILGCNKFYNISGCSSYSQGSSSLNILLNLSVSHMDSLSNLHLQATSEVGAEKQIQQLLFPRSRRKKCMNSWRRA